MKSYEVDANMGSVKIVISQSHNGENYAAVFLNNGVGDGQFMVHVLEGAEQHEGVKMAGYFEIYVGLGKLMPSDCSSSNNQALHEFGPGRYYATHHNGNVSIKRFDLYII